MDTISLEIMCLIFVVLFFAVTNNGKPILVTLFYCNLILMQFNAVQYKLQRVKTSKIYRHIKISEENSYIKLKYYAVKVH